MPRASAQLAAAKEQGYYSIGRAAGIPVAAGVLYPIFGLLLIPLIAALAMSLSSVSVLGNALRLRGQT